MLKVHQDFVCALSTKNHSKMQIIMWRIMQDASETELRSPVLYKTCYIFGNIFPIVQCCPHLLSTNSNLSVGCALVHNFDRKDALRCVCSWKICNLRPVCFVIVNSKIFVKATSTTVVTLLCTYSTIVYYGMLYLF